MGDGGIITDLIHLAMLPHHLVVRVYEEAAPVFVSACVEAGPVRHETLDVVDGHLGVDFVASRYDDIFFHLDTAGPPEDEKSAPSRLTLQLHHIANVVTYFVSYLRGKLALEFPVAVSNTSVVFLL